MPALSALGTSEEELQLGCVSPSQASMPETRPRRPRRPPSPCCLCCFFLCFPCSRYVSGGFVSHLGHSLDATARPVCGWSRCLASPPQPLVPLSQPRATNMASADVTPLACAAAAPTLAPWPPLFSCRRARACTLTHPCCLPSVWVVVVYILSFKTKKIGMQFERK